MKRRGFLGFVGGAAVAGPSVAKDAVAKLPIGLGVGGSGGQVGAATPGLSSGNKLQRIFDLKRLIAGNLTDEERSERKRRKLYQRDQLISQEVASLRSVSGVRKLDIYQDRLQRVNDEIERQHNMSYLNQLLSDKLEY